MMIGTLTKFSQTYTKGYQFKNRFQVQIKRSTQKRDCELKKIVPLET